MVFVYEFIENSKDAQSEDELISMFTKALLKMGFTSYAYLNMSVLDGGKPLSLHEYDAEWADHYDNKSYYEIDPVLLAGKQNSLPFRWGPGSQISGSSKILKSKQKSFMNEATEFGICQGFTVPIIGSDLKSRFITTVMDSNERDFDKIISEYQHELHIMGVHFDAIMSKFYLPVSEKKDLSKREIECLQWAVRGKFNSEISDLLHISEKTIEHHFSSIYRKMNVSNRVQAVVQGLQHRIVSL